MADNPRKQYPLYSGLFKYFPLALREVAHVSFVANEQHNPGTNLHWDRSKSGDEADALLRHLLDAGTIDTDGLRHTAKVAWRALALLEKELEAAAKVITAPPPSSPLLPELYLPGPPVPAPHTHQMIDHRDTGSVGSIQGASGPAPAPTLNRSGRQALMQTIELIQQWLDQGAPEPEWYTELDKL